MASNYTSSRAESSTAYTSAVFTPVEPSAIGTQPSMQDAADLTQETLAQTPTIAAETSYEPVLMGIYGIDGSGVERLRRPVELSLGYDEFQYFDLLHEFSELEQASSRPTPWRSEDELANLRNRVISNIREQCRKTGKIGIVFGHRKLFPEDLRNADGPTARSSFLPLDADFSCVFYYSAPPAAIVRALHEKASQNKLSRRKLTQKMVRMWGTKEFESLITFSATNRIPLEALRSVDAEQPSTALIKMLVEMINVNTQTNQHRVVSQVVEAMITETAPSNAVVLMEGNNILARDIGVVTLCDRVVSMLTSCEVSSAAATRRDTYRILRDMPDRHMGRAHMREMTMDPELERLLWKLTEMRIPTLILTCDQKKIWKRVLRQSSNQEHFDERCPWEKPSEQTHPILGNKVKVIGTGGEASDQIVVTPEDKAAVVRALRMKHGRRVLVIGGTELDVPMLKAAGQDAFIRPPYVGELHPSAKALLQENGGQATLIAPRAEAFHLDWQVRGRDIYDAMGLNVDEGACDDDGIFQEPVTELEEILGEMERVLACEEGGSEG